MTFKNLIKSFWPDADHVSFQEKTISGFAALIAIGVVLAVSRHFLSGSGVPLVVASMGASAVLLFGVPNGPLSQPWPFVGGHLISGFVGISSAQWISGPVAAGAIAVAAAILAMYFSRSLHPPGGATALTAVLGGPELRELGYQFLITPLTLNLLIMLFAALVINNLLPRRSYPASLHALARRMPADAHAPPKRPEIVFDQEDLGAALQDLGFYVDVSDDDLSRIYNHTVSAIQRKHFGEMLCGEIMTREVVTAEYSTPVQELWEIMQRYGVRGTPVVDRKGFVLGVVGVADFLERIANSRGARWSDRVQTFLRPSRSDHTDKPECAGHLMSRPPITVFEDQHILDLAPLFYENRVHHVPVLDKRHRLVGIVTPRHLVYAIKADLRLIERN